MSISRSLGFALVLSIGFGMSASAQVSSSKDALIKLLAKNTATVTPKATVVPSTTPKGAILPKVTPPRPGGSNGCGPRPIRSNPCLNSWFGTSRKLASATSFFHALLLNERTSVAKRTTRPIVIGGTTLTGEIIFYCVTQRFLLLLFCRPIQMGHNFTFLFSQAASKASLPFLSI